MFWTIFACKFFLFTRHWQDLKSLIWDPACEPLFLLGCCLRR